MTVELTLMPCIDGENYSHNLISVGGVDIIMYYKLKDLKGTEVNNNFRGFHADNGYGKLTEDKYGIKLEFVTAGQLKSIEFSPPEAAYINALEDDVPVVLYWS